MNSLFVTRFPNLVANFQPLPTDEGAGVTGWDNYANVIAELLGCNTDDLLYINGELLRTHEEHEEFSDLEGWIENQQYDSIYPIHACIDGEFETVRAKIYHYKELKQSFIRVSEFQGEIQAYYLPINFIR
jgi:hypothetical protein